VADALLSMVNIVLLFLQVAIDIPREYIAYLLRENGWCAFPLPDRHLETHKD
jgi:hypothetical protein